MDKTKTTMGLLDLGIAPITAEPAAALPTYGSPKSLGHAVRAALTVQTANTPVYGDDALQLTIDEFIRGVLEVQTLMDDLEISATLFGGTYASGSGITRTVADSGTPVAVYGLRKLMKKDKSLVYRAEVFFRCEANRAASGWDADTKSQSFQNKTANTTFDVYSANSGAWCWEQDFSSAAAALEAIYDKLDVTAPSSTTTTTTP